jgi:hypothetical protein
MWETKLHTHIHINHSTILLNVASIVEKIFLK